MLNNRHVQYGVVKHTHLFPKGHNDVTVSLNIRVAELGKLGKDS
jgi:hypothetical protein